jgi:hypothetical protein
MISSGFSSRNAEPIAAHNEGRAVLVGNSGVGWAALSCLSLGVGLWSAGAAVTVLQRYFSLERD